MFRIRVCLIAICLLVVSSSVWAVDPAVIEAQNRRVAVAEKVASGVVAIFARGGRGGGSGVLITPDGYALTNFHVTNSAGTFMKCGLNDGRLYDAVIVGIDPTGDVALIKLLGRKDFPFVELGDSDKLKVGDWAFAMGNPFCSQPIFNPRSLMELSAAFIVISIRRARFWSTPIAFRSTRRSTPETRAALCLTTTASWSASTVVARSTNADV